MLYEIKHRITGAVLYACDGESLREVVEAAVEISVDLSYADLRGASLSYADLGGADLTDAGVKIAAGCFFGSLEEFRAAVTKTHEGGLHGREYAAAIQMVEVHAELWAAKETNDER